MTGKFFFQFHAANTIKNVKQNLAEGKHFVGNLAGLFHDWPKMPQISVYLKLELFLEL